MIFKAPTLIDSADNISSVAVLQEHINLRYAVIEKDFYVVWSVSSYVDLISIIDNSFVI